MKTLQVGDKAPAIKLLSQNREKVALADFGGQRVLVYFCPKADTPGCTQQGCALRDTLPVLGQAGVRVLGISPDAPEVQERFDRKHKLGFLLLADEDHKVAEAYGVWGEKSLYGKTYMGIIRSAFLVDADGRLAGAWYKISPADTVPTVRQALGL